MIIDGVEYGVLGHLVGTWRGEGLDIAPHPQDGVEENPFYDELSFEAIGTVTNAKAQTLSALFYRHKVYGKKSGNQFHDQSGYFLYDEQNNTIMHSFSIPRGVNVLCVGEAKGSDPVIIELSASKESGGGIVESAFMSSKAKTLSYTMRIELSKDTLSYTQETILDIYGQSFTHIDQSSMQKTS